MLVHHLKFYSRWFNFSGGDITMQKSRRLIIFLASLVILTALNTGFLKGIGISESYTKIFCEFIALLVFLLAFKNNLPKRTSITHAAIFVFPLATIAISGFITGTSGPDGIKGGIIFARWIMGYALFGVALFLIVPSEKEVHLVKYIVVGLILIQPVIAVIKLIIYGIGETPWIGTLHQSAAQFGLLLPLLVISFLLPRFLIKNHFLSLLLILPFIFFSIVYEKRAGLFMIPIWIVTIYFAYLILRLKHKALYLDTKTKKSTEVKKGALIFIPIIVSFIFISLLNPSFYPEKKISGTLSLKYIAGYTNDYLFRDYNHPMNRSDFNDVDKNNDIQIGRFRGIIKIWAHIIDQKVYKMLLGFGGGYINSSHLLGADRVDIMYNRIGIRSTIPAACSLVIEAGVFGFSMAVLWFFSVSLLLIKILWSSSSPRSILNSFIMIFVFAVIAFDFFIYSSVIWTSGVISPLLFALIGCKIGEWYKYTFSSRQNHKFIKIGKATA